MTILGHFVQYQIILLEKCVKTRENVNTVPSIFISKIYQEKDFIIR